MKINYESIRPTEHSAIERAYSQKAVKETIKIVIAKAKTNRKQAFEVLLPYELSRAEYLGVSHRLRKHHNLEILHSFIAGAQVSLTVQKYNRK